jgi:hypothetical protein
MSTMTPRESAPGGRRSRPCPAIGGPISPADCGAQRGSKLDCPGTCPFFPFGSAGYDRLIEVEQGWQHKTLRRLVRELGAPRLQKLTAEASPDGRMRDEDLTVAAEFMMHRVLLRERDASGRTYGERWAAERWAGLTNDERVYMEHWLRGSGAVLEVQRVAGEQEIECTDLLADDGRVFTLVDRALARDAVRYARILTFVYHFRRMSRVSGAILVIDPSLWPLWRERLEERSSEARMGPREFVTQRFMECAAWLPELSRAQRARLVSSMELNQCVGTWTLEAPMADVAGVLRGLPDFEEEEPEAAPGFPTPSAHFDWLRRGASKALEDEMPAMFRTDRRTRASVCSGACGSIPTA